MRPIEAIIGSSSSLHENRLSGTPAADDQDIQEEWKKEENSPIRMGFSAQSMALDEGAIWQAHRQPQLVHCLASALLPFGNLMRAIDLGSVRWGRYFASSSLLHSIGLSVLGFSSRHVLFFIPLLLISQLSLLIEDPDRRMHTHTLMASTCVRVTLA